MEYKRINTEALAREAEVFVFEAVKPGGIADMGIPVPILKDRLAWLSWSNLMRDEQPTFGAYESNKLVGVIIGEPIEITFDIGESEIQDIILLPEYQNDEIVGELMRLALDFYNKNGAKQTHVWCEKRLFENGDMNLKCRVAIEKFGFKFLGFERVSKWSGKDVIKLEKVW